MPKTKLKPKRKQWLVWVGWHDDETTKYGKAYQVLETTDYEYETVGVPERLNKRIKFKGEMGEDFACRRSFITRTEYARMAKRMKKSQRNPNLYSRVET